MSRLANTTGIILRRIKHLDADTRITVFSREYGRLLITVKGGQRPESKWKALQEPFAESDFQFYIREHGYYGRLVGGKLIRSHENLRRHVFSFQTASRCCEVLDVLMPLRAASPDVYDILRHTLEILPRSLHPEWEWVLFVTRFLKSLGHGDLSSQLMALSEGKPEDTAKAIKMTDEELAKLLPWPLKSDVFSDSLKVR